jgi:hypothetical protein
MDASRCSRRPSSFVVVKGLLALVAAHDDVVEGAVKLDSGLSRHAGTVSVGKTEWQINQYSGPSSLPADPTPSGVQRGVLPEARFVGANQRPVFSLGFFLRLGYVWRCQRSCWRASARASRRRGRCTEKPRPWRNLRTCAGW